MALSNPDLEASRQAFVQVVSLWPEHPKVPDALYKLGVVYDQLGVQSDATRYFQRVLAEHPDSAAAAPNAKLSRPSRRLSVQAKLSPTLRITEIFHSLQGKRAPLAAPRCSYA